MTAGALVDDVHASFAAGMDDHLSKPVRAQELASALRRVRAVAPQPAAIAPPAEAGLPPVLDPSALEAITGHLGPDAAAFRQRLVDAWVADSSQQLARLASAVDTGDAAAVADVAHSMRSASAALGALRVAHRFEQLETVARADPADPAALGALAAAAAAEVDRAREAFAE